MENLNEIDSIINAINDDINNLCNEAMPKGSVVLKQSTKNESRIKLETKKSALATKIVEKSKKEQDKNLSKMTKDERLKYYQNNKKKVSAIATKNNQKMIVLDVDED